MASGKGVIAKLRGTGMNVIRTAGGTMLLATLVAGCAIPKQYMGIDMRTPLTLVEQVQVEAALIDTPAASRGCPWFDPADKLTTIPC